MANEALDRHYTALWLAWYDRNHQEPKTVDRQKCPTCGVPLMTYEDEVDRLLSLLDDPKVKPELMVRIEVRREEIRQDKRFDGAHGPLCWGCEAIEKMIDTRYFKKIAQEEAALLSRVRRNE